MSDRTKILLLLTPALSIIILLFFGGLFIGLLRSFNYMPIIGLTEPNLNAYFSASGIITFKNSSELQSTFKKIPLNKVLIETDSPFLAPVPMRGNKNEPSYLKYTLEKLAEIKNISSNELDEITSQNFNNLFA